MSLSSSGLAFAFSPFQQNASRCACRHGWSVVSSASNARGMVSGTLRPFCPSPRDTDVAAFRLPQWEGVQRKWYYVQRATGKSQWEIPTEPVILTPSTTPGSIGTGPSQAPPSRPSTNSPQISLARKTLAEKIEAVAERSKTSVWLLSMCSKRAFEQRH